MNRNRIWESILQFVFDFVMLFFPSPNLDILLSRIIQNLRPAKILSLNSLLRNTLLQVYFKSEVK